MSKTLTGDDTGTAGANGVGCLGPGGNGSVDNTVITDLRATALAPSEDSLGAVSGSSAVAATPFTPEPSASRRADRRGPRPTVQRRHLPQLEPHP